MYSIKTFNKISEKGLSLFPESLYQVSAQAADPIAYVLRSQKLHGEPISDGLIAVARAGAGVNNLPVEQYTEKGIVAFNTPGANANAVKELVLGAMLLSSRDILGGKVFVEGLTHLDDAQEMHKLLEAEKKRFAGSELKGKTLGVVGLGAIGSMVAEMALAMGMNVVGFDPAISVEAAWRLPSQVTKKENLNALLCVSDYVSLHVPALESTRHMMNSDTLAAMKPSAALVNFARDAIVDGKAVVAALDAGKLRQYVCDFPEPAFLGRHDVIALPHIGASTAEAEENCAVMAVNQVRDFIENGNILNSVNFPQAAMSRAEGTWRITFSNQNVSGVLGHVLTLFADKGVNVVDMVNKSRGDIAYNILDVAEAPGQEILAAIQAVENVIKLRVFPA